MGGGILLGRYLALRQVSQMIESYTTKRFLGNIVEKHLREEIAKSYKDPAFALKNLDNFSWSPLNIPAPFVGSAPMPDDDSRVGINAMGFRCGHEFAVPKPEGVRRIFIVGGSTAYGSGAPDVKSTVGAYLQALLREKSNPSGDVTWEVVVAANPGWATTHERILIENRISRFDPDLVISLSGNNDVHWGLRGRDVMWFRTYADVHFFNLVKTSYELSGLDLSRDVVAPVGSPVAPMDVARNLVKNVALGSYVLSLERVPYCFFLQPSISTSGKRLTVREERHVEREAKRISNMQEYFRECYMLIRENLAAMNDPNLHFFDLSGIFDEYGDDVEIFLDSYHFGDRGNETIAEAIFKSIDSLFEKN